MKLKGLLTLLLLTLGNKAFAYLDPGTGSVIIQGLIATIAGGLYFIKLYWYKIKGFFSRKNPLDEEDI